MVTNCNVTSKMSSCIVTKCHLACCKNCTLIITILTTTNRKKSAAVVVNFKKLKEKRKREDVENLDLLDPL